MAAVVTATVKVEGLNNALEQFKQDIAAACKEAIVDAMTVAEKVAYEHIKRQTKKRTGALGSSANLERTMPTPFKGILGWLVKHAVFIDRGTRAHIIVPRRKKFLSWIDEHTGKRIFARRVKHPGTSPRPFSRPAADTGRLVMIDTLNKRIGEAAVRVGK